MKRTHRWFQLSLTCVLVITPLEVSANAVALLPRWKLKLTDHLRQEKMPLVERKPPPVVLLRDKPLEGSFAKPLGGHLPTEPLGETFAKPLGHMPPPTDIVWRPPWQLGGQQGMRWPPSRDPWPLDSDSFSPKTARLTAARLKEEATLQAHARQARVDKDAARLLRDSGFKSSQASWERSLLLDETNQHFIGFDEFSDRTRFLFFREGNQTKAVVYAANGRADFLLPAQWFPLYAAAIKGRLSEQSKDDVSWFSLLPTPTGGGLLQFAKHKVAISKADYERIKRGEDLPNSHPAVRALVKGRTLFVHHAHALMQRNASAHLDVAENLVRSLQRLNARIVADPLDGSTASRIARVREFDAAQRVSFTAVLPDKLHGVIDGHMLPNIKDELIEAGTDVLTYEQASSHLKPLALKTLAPTLLVVSGHAAPEFGQFVADLGAQGVLEDRIILLESCETLPTRQLIREMTGKYKATAVFAFEGVITTDQLEPATIDLAHALTGAPVRAQPGKSKTKSTLERIRDALTKHHLKAVLHVERAVAKSVLPA
jgi:hypothetical protein